MLAEPPPVPPYYDVEMCILAVVVGPKHRIEYVEYVETVRLTLPRPSVQRNPDQVAGDGDGPH